MSKTATIDTETYDGPSAAEVLKAREQNCFPMMSYYKEPMLIARGKGQYVWDDKGRKYLDGFAGVVTVSVGHCHPVVVERTKKQLEKLWHTTSLYLYPELPRYAEKLLKKLKPANPKLDAVFFTNCGTEATELAAILCKAYTGRSEFIGLRHSFHGRTMMSMTLTGQSTWRHSTPYLPGVNLAPSNYTYRRPSSMNPTQYAEWCADEVKNIIDHATPGKIAGYIAEPIQGNGGCIMPEPEYFPRVYKHVKDAGGLYITDEVQCGVGRTGNVFLGIENWGVQPDIVDMAKGLGNGYPMGAVATTREIADSLKGRLHFNTFGGNPVACTVGEAVLDVLESEKLPQNAKVQGDYLIAKLKQLQTKDERIGEVRGLGLMLGVELVKDAKSKTADAVLATDVLEKMKAEGVLIGKGGQAGNVLRIKPPMCITKENADQLVDAFEKALKR
ncbi:MAG: aspartate aminotransferase family protein [Elusimicrobia bacterium]|nr:aspartate aminotransferase family protein [Elusimicrobiota bacterium]